MPQVEIERLEKGSSKAQISAAVSACIASEVRSGTDQQQAIAMCHSMAREKTGGKPPEKEGANA